MMTTSVLETRLDGNGKTQTQLCLTELPTEIIIQFAKKVVQDEQEWVGSADLSRSSFLRILGLIAKPANVSPTSARPSFSKPSILPPQYGVWQAVGTE